MDVSGLRKLVSRSPFRPFVLTLHAGVPVEVRHPESIGITDALIVVVDAEGIPVVFEPEMVVSFRYRKNGRLRKHG